MRLATSVVEAVAELGPEPCEAVVAEDLAGDPVGGVETAARPDEGDDLGLGDRPQNPLDERGAEEPGAPSDEEPAAAETFGDTHPGCLPFGRGFCLPYGR